MLSEPSEGDEELGANGHGDPGGEEHDFEEDEEAGEVEDLEEDAEAAGAAKMSRRPTVVRIEGPGMRFERQVSEEQVLRLLQFLLTGDGGSVERGGGSGASQSTVNSGGGVGGGGRRTALSEFYRTAGPKKYPEKLVTIAAYLQEVVGRESFTADDLRGQFRGVNEPPPANMPRDFRSAVGMGWIAEDHDSPGQYYVTNTGLELVRAGFSAEGRKSIRKRRRKKNGGARGAKESPASDSE